MRRRKITLKIMTILIQEEPESTWLFIGREYTPHKTQEFLTAYIDSIVSNYKDNSEVFDQVLDLLDEIIAANKDVEEDLERVITWLFKDCKFVQYVSPIMLDSDNILQIEGGLKNDKRLIVKRVFKFFEDILNSDDFDKKTKKVILKYIYKQPGLTDNIILNLNQPDDDDVTILSSQMVIIGNMC